MNRIFRYLILVYLALVARSDEDCPSKCVCKSSTKDSANWIKPMMKVRCGDTEKIQSLDEINLLIIANETVQL